MRTIIALLLAGVAFRSAAQEHYVPYLQKDLLLAIAACATENCVEAAVARAPYLDPPLRLISASKLHQLDSPLARQRLLDAIPRDPVAFWFCYSVSEPSVGKRFKPVQTLYDLYFPAVAQTASKTGRLHEYLVMRSFADGGIAATIAEDVEGVKERNPTAYCAALKTLHDKVRRYLPACGKTR
jgi:hypothetical protein